MNITINGKPYQTNQSRTVAELLTELGWKPTQVVVEHNGCVLLRSQIGQVHLKQGDQLEIILPVAGG